MDLEKIDVWLEKLRDVVKVAEPDLREIKHISEGNYEFISIRFKNGYSQTVNIKCNSLSATLRVIIEKITMGTCIGDMHMCEDELREFLNERKKG